MIEPPQVYYADFEASTDNGLHRAYCVCYQSADGSINKHYYGQPRGCTGSELPGEYCATSFLNDMPDKALIYFHNLSYDINFIVRYLQSIRSNDTIIKNGRTMQLKGRYKNKRLTFKDSYTIISTKLSRFPTMFHLDSGAKEKFPYD